ncbi:MAG: ACT domain-containing protein [Sphaerochaetaceae bacterium]|jgi:hypothetical protein
MKLEVLDHEFAVYKLSSLEGLELSRPFMFASRTDKEFSLVCPCDMAIGNVIARDEGWRAFRISGLLDFSLIGILSKLSGLLAQARIGIFAISTYDTDYVLVKSQSLERALEVLAANGYEISHD